MTDKDTKEIKNKKAIEVTEDKSKVKKKVKGDSKPEKILRADLSKINSKQLQQMQEDYKKLALEIKTNKEADTSRLSAMRKDIARAYTILNSQQN